MWKYYIFLYLCVVGGISSPPCSYSYSSDKEEWIQRKERGGGGGGGGWMRHGPPQLNVSGSSVAAGQTFSPPQRFLLISRLCLLRPVSPRRGGIGGGLHAARLLAATLTR